MRLLLEKKAPLCKIVQRVFLAMKGDFFGT